MNDLLDDVMGYSLDSEQRKVIYAKEKNILVVAGAGSGKTLTMVGKIRYLIEKEKIPPEEILCISYTKEATESLKAKLKKSYGYNIEIYTFHKLALEIIKEQSKTEVKVSPADLFDYTIQEYFYGIVLEKEEAIQRILKYFHISRHRNIEETYQQFLKNNPKEILAFEKLLSKFLHLFKEQGYQEKDFYRFAQLNHAKNWFYKKNKNDYFFMIALDIYLFYQQELTSTNMLDFSDMILKAEKLVKVDFKRKYQYILIDEYQDTSLIRLHFIQEILKKTNARLLAVGDDYQSIFQFAGSNLETFLNFQSYFENSAIYKITSTYRNSQQLIDIAGKFIMKNKKQIKKELHSKKNIVDPIEIYKSKNPKQTLFQLLENLKDTKEDIFILGRNNQDIKNYLDENLEMDKEGNLSYKKCPHLKIRYLTIHRSKGLEASFVIIIHVVEDLLGLPSKMEDDEILKYVLKKQEYYPYEEERRLFYVALTRSKNKVYILTNLKCPSRFLKELEHDFKLKTYNEL